MTEKAKAGPTLRRGGFEYFHSLEFAADCGLRIADFPPDA